MCVEYGDPNFKFSEEPDSLKIEEPDFFCSKLKLRAYFLYVEYWEPNFRFSEEPGIIAVTIYNLVLFQSVPEMVALVSLYAHEWSSIMYENIDLIAKN